MHRCGLTHTNVTTKTGMYSKAEGNAPGRGWAIMNVTSQKATLHAAEVKSAACCAQSSERQCTDVAL
jgi:hypothetical protein